MKVSGQGWGSAGARPQGKRASLWGGPVPTLTWTDTTPASAGSQTTGPHRWGSQAPATPERVGRMPHPLPWAQEAPSELAPSTAPTRQRPEALRLQGQGPGDLGRQPPQMDPLHITAL